MNTAPICYRIDASDRIVSVNAAWSEFARANLGYDSLPDRVIGEELWSFVGDETTRELYRRMVLRVRAGHTVQFRYRCDAPAERRVFEMRISAAAAGEVEFRSELVSREARSPVNWLDRTVPRSEEFVTMCGWCGRVALGAGQWVEVEQAIEQHQAFQTVAIPQITHGICRECFQHLTALLPAGPAAGHGK